MNHHPCLFHVFGLDKISLSRTVCCVVISTETSWLHLFTFLSSTHEGIRSLAGDICWRYLCLILRLLSDESLKWTCLFFFFITSVSSSPSVLALCQFSPHWVSANPVCSTEFSHLLFNSFSMTGASWLNTHTHTVWSQCWLEHTHWGS